MGMLGMRAYPFEEKLSRVGRYFAGKSFKTTSEALFRRANVRNTASNAFAVQFSSFSLHAPRSPVPAAQPTISTRMVRKRGNGVGAWHGKRKRLTESIYEPGKIPNPPELGCLKLGRGTAGGRRATCKIERVDTLIEILLP